MSVQHTETIITVASLKNIEATEMTATIETTEQLKEQIEALITIEPRFTGIYE